MPKIQNRLAAGVADISATLSSVQQTMDGFGGSDAYLGGFPLSDAQADLFFGTGPGQIGLTFLRTAIASDGTKFRGDYSNCTKAVARGAKVWAAPWTAPAAWKDNSSETSGGHLLTGHYDDWGTRLAAFQADLNANAGVNLYALSVQNEPDFTASYESMIYTTAEMTNFVKVIGPKVAALSPTPRLVLAEPSTATTNADYVAAVQADGTAAPYLDICAWHQYSNTTPAVAGHTNWQTEMSSFEAFDGGMANGLTVAGWMHDAIANSNVNAWIWWWLFGHDTSNQGLIGDSNATTPTTKRFFVMGHFSKFVRPGHVRVATSGSISGISVTAYKSSAGSVVFVLVNANGSDVTANIGVSGLNMPSMTPWVTDATRDLVALAPICPRNNVVSVTMPASSVTTLVGVGT
jgi:glucuronoarabinoxylan endo-1,4-beta-xylanase